MYAFGSMYPGNEALTCKAICCGRIEKPFSEHIQSGLEDRDSKKTEYCITKRQEDHTGNSGEDLRQHASQPAYVTVSGHAVTLHVCWPLWWCTYNSGNRHARDVIYCESQPTTHSLYTATNPLLHM